jgi:sec-independent protein translocase protein TatC
MNEDIEDSKMPLLDHLIELRRRMLWSFVALAIAFAICFYYAKPIWDVLKEPLRIAGQEKLIYTDLFEAFFVEIKVALWAAMMVAFPVFATQIWRFVAPGLYRNEKRAFLPFLMMTPILFGLGASLAFFFAIPVALNFLLSFTVTNGDLTQEALPGVGNYLSFVTTFIFGFGVAFQLPVLIMLLERAGIVSRDQLVAGRRYAIVGSFAVAAVLTPPDVVSQLLLGVPLCLLYELSIAAIWFTQRRQKAKEDKVEGNPIL